MTSGGLGAPFSKATLALDFFLFSGFGVPGCESKSVHMDLHDEISDMLV